MPCRAHWLQLQQRREEFARLGIEIYVVTFDEVERAREYVEKNRLGWPLLLDPVRAVYQGFGMGRANWWTLMGPSSMWKYIVMWLKGGKPQKVGSDVHQLGGDVLIDPAGVLRLNYVSKTPHDRPSIQSLIDLVESATSSLEN